MEVILLKCLRKSASISDANAGRLCGTLEAKWLQLMNGGMALPQLPCLKMEHIGLMELRRIPGDRKERLKNGCSSPDGWRVTPSASVEFHLVFGEDDDVVSKEQMGESFSVDVNYATLVPGDFTGIPAPSKET
ncbi:unnamed protein product [Soboliphyme baturini]|uniref:Uncharacterized protein n=1 Tax=Soboliphyme baturini TaxID=241478 RepID=A0A183ITG0_9BILA|nr:unnamed protein product [Soboliphyme baturini]